MPRLQQRPPDRLTDEEVERLLAIPEPWAFVREMAGLAWAAPLEVLWERYVEAAVRREAAVEGAPSGWDVPRNASPTQLESSRSRHRR